MNTIDIRRGTGVLILARPGVLPLSTRKASDRQQLPSAISGLAQDPSAMASLRAQWTRVFPNAHIMLITDDGLARQVRDALAARQIEAVLLRDASIPLTPAELTYVQRAIANVRMQRGQLIIAGKGALPANLRPYVNPEKVVQELGVMQDIDDGARLLDQQASVLSSFGVGGRGRALRMVLATKIRQGVLDAAYVPPGPVGEAVDRQLKTTGSVSQMGYADKVGAALERSLPHLSGEVAAAVAEMITPANLAIMAAVFVAVALANTNPVTGAAVDTILIGIAWFSAGLAGIRAIGNFIEATANALKAESEAELDAAGQVYAKALVGLGSALIQALMARFLTKKGGTTDDAASGGKGGGKPAPAPPPPAPKPVPKPPTVSSNPAQLPISSKAKIEAALAAKNADLPVPPPSSYLSKEYIDHHLADFRDGSVYKVIGGPPRDGPFGGDKLFVLPKSEIDAALAKSGGDPRKLEKLLTMDDGYLGDTPYLLEFPNPKNLGMATGNEANAWKGMWEPGGFTKGGIKEAVIDGKVDPLDFIATPIKRTP